MLLCELFAPWILSLFGAASAELGFAVPYLRIYLTGTVFLMVSTGMNPYINAQGYATIGMKSVLAGAVSNIVLDPVFIFTFGLGVNGAAIATVVSQFLSMLFVVKCTNSLVSAACNNVLIHTGGTLYVSVMTIISSVRQILDTPILAVTEGASPVISYNYGAQKPKRVLDAIRMMTVIAITYTCFMWILIEKLPLLFIRIFSDDRVLQQLALRPLHLYFFAFVFQAFQYSGQTVFKSLNKKKQAIFFSLFRKVILVVPLTFLLPYVFHMGTDGVFIAEPVSNVVGGLSCFATMAATMVPELKRMDRKR